MNLYKLTLLLYCAFNCLNAQNTYLFVGSYVKGEKGESLHVYDFKDGKTTEVTTLKETPNSGYFELSSDGKFLYCAHDKGWKNKGTVGVYSFNPVNPELQLLQQIDAQGISPCHISIGSNDQLVAISNYNGSNVVVYPIEGDGTLNDKPQVFEYTGSSIVPKRQAKSHVHSSNFSPDNRYIYSPDLGTDYIHAIEIGANNNLKKSKKLTTKTKKGAGPRHFTFHPNGAYAYVINELNGTVVSYSYKKGKLKSIDEDFSYSKKQTTYGSADIHISPDGKFLYTSNRWKDENTIAIFSINSNGTLDLVGHQSTFGDHPRNFVIDPTGRFLLVANKNTNNIVIFKRNITTGVLTKTGTEIKVDQPTCLKFKTY